MLNYEKTNWNPEKVSNMKPFINKYNWEKINYLSKIDYWKTFEKNSQTILHQRKKDTFSLYLKSYLNTSVNNNSINYSRKRKRTVALSCIKKKCLHY